MNAKKAKQVRKLLKSEGIDVNHTLYDLTGSSITLSDNCGRKLYKKSKQFARGA
ncbi:hypothetical protein AAS21_gp099 [Pantoea phage vB_PagS_AAS21]|uniref:Uncharacterized protein n=1 Tax=Pantoea phage vB_PagS_AAS21 TaxID=2575261 RepID=A0A4Y5P1L5_9CAUD|nr:hypothetical protein AAS21_gp099 [Pantoea phage vB_PagS_AAS21]